MTPQLTLAARCSVAAASIRNRFRSCSPQLSLLTDFGSGDEAVYAVKSAAKMICPSIGIEDICHDVPLGNILLGAWRLQRAVDLPTESPGTVYAAVVDPGVGSARRNIIAETEDGRFLVGPDNGVLSLAFSSMGLKRVVEIENQSLTLLHLARSRTFHGKDVFAPAAAHLLRGVPAGEFGRELCQSDLARISISSRSSDLSREGHLVDVDGFGSVRTNVPNHIPERLLGKVVGFEITGPEGRIRSEARLVRTFSEARRGEPVFVLSSTGCLDLAVNLGSASEKFNIPPESIVLGPDLVPLKRIVLDLAG
ncbi:MAG: SAM-dependent chlorinase/fluorinase [Candidatus Micrarchaeia archaeon]